MEIKASDLPSGVKRAILGKIKDQVGSTDYDRMVDALGEDGLIDTLLKSSPDTPSSRPSGKVSGYRQSPWSAAGEVVVAFLGAAPWVWFWLAVGTGWRGFAGVLGFFILLYFGTVFCHAIGALKAVSAGLAWVVGVTVGGAAVAGIGYVLWIGVPWIISGIMQWWGWLGGRFTG